MAAPVGTIMTQTLVGNKHRSRWLLVSAFRSIMDIALDVAAAPTLPTMIRPFVRSSFLPSDGRSVARSVENRDVKSRRTICGHYAESSTGPPRRAGRIGFLLRSREIHVAPRRAVQKTS